MAVVVVVAVVAVVVVVVVVVKALRNFAELYNGAKNRIMYVGHMVISLLRILRISNKRWLVLIALFPCGFLPLHAASLNDLTYTTTDGKVTISDCDKAAAGELVIPETIEGNPVTSIGEEVFSSCVSLKGITIGNGVTNIGEGAFKACRSLESITIPDSVTSIGDGAFQGSSLKQIIFKGVAPEGGYDAFKGLRYEVIAYVTDEARSSFGDPGDYWNGLSIKVGDGPPNPESSEGSYAGLLVFVPIVLGMVLLLYFGVKSGHVRFVGSGSCSGYSDSGGDSGGDCGGGCGGGE